MRIIAIAMVVVVVGMVVVGMVMVGGGAAPAAPLTSLTKGTDEILQGAQAYHPSQLCTIHRRRVLRLLLLWACSAATTDGIGMP